MTTATSGEATTASAAVELYPQVDFFADPALSGLPRLFEPEWIWRAYERRNGKQAASPHRIRVREFSHGPGRTAVVSYEAEWDPDAYIPPRRFTIRIARDKPAELFQYPEDRYLPGLGQAAHPDTALTLINRHVLTIRARRLRVELVRYRPASRAVLRHRVGKVRFYARVMRPAAAAPLLAARDLAGRSGFVVPRLAGYWRDGAVTWMSEIPGRNLRDRIGQGRGPDAAALFDALETLWNVPPEADGGRPFDLSAAYRRARRSFRHKVGDDDTARRHLRDAAAVLDPFVRSWQPSGTAHNDFYDDQMLVVPDGRIALVDFEEAGPGDQMLDVGNFLAHLRWASRFGRRRETSARASYRDTFREGALERFGWSERELALREAVCLFRVCTNAIRHPRPDWRDQLRDGLSMVNETLG